MMRVSLFLFLFVSTSLFCQDLIEVKSWGRYGFYKIDEEGRSVETIRAKYEDTRGFKDGLAAVQWNKKWGYINGSDSIIIPFSFENTFGFSEGSTT